ncbi:hypothetical protein QOZ80_3BG0255230 [Eleusine coracana subsp. coracana]|nr:hypothetical protein QOZ80_3BG0255230 [Eleusine coracana subsp. coracana]
MSLGYPLLRLPSRCSLAASAAPRLGSLSPLPISVSLSASASASSNGSGGDGELTARERRQQRRERRELRATDWKEEVQDRLIHEPARRRKKPPKRTWREELNLDLLAELGPQWWLVRVSMAPGTDYVDLLTKAISRRFSEVPFKIYNPSIQVKRRLKSGSISVKSKPLHPGLVFLHCTLNKELHDFIRDTEGCYGFIGATVGSIKRQIKKPKPIPLEEIESIIKEEKEEQERVDREFEEMDNMGNVESLSKPVEDSELMLMNKIKKQFKKSPAKSSTSHSHSAFIPGASIHVLLGPFTGFTGSLLEVNRKNKKATAQLSLFGKESFVDLDFDQIEAVGTDSNGSN